MMELHQAGQTFEEQALGSLQHAFVVESNKTFTNQLSSKELSLLKKKAVEQLEKLLKKQSKN